ncbi:MAG: TolC family protein [Desulfobacterales bacterium]
MKVAIAMLICLIFPGVSSAVDIHELLDAAARQPGYEISTLSVQESGLQQDRATAALFPKIGLFGRAEIYNSPTNLRPVTPTEASMAAFGESVPFSEEILRYGLSFEAPVYVHELYVLRRKADLLCQKAETDRQLDLLGRQAAVVSLNSALTYLQGLGRAIEARHASLRKTLEDMALKVKTGRSPESELVKIQKTLNDLDQQANDLAAKRLDILREIKALTGMELTGPVAMTLLKKPDGASYLPVDAAQYNADAAQKEVERRRAARYPTLAVTGFLSGNDGEAYNTGNHIYRSYNEAALVLKIPLFDRSLSSDEAIARVQAEKAQKQLDQTRIDMAALADALDRKIPILEKSIDLAQKSIADSEMLLSVANVAVRSGRMTLEDYLRYESDVLSAQAALYQARQQRWQVLSQQAALYGTDLKGVVK